MGFIFRVCVVTVAFLALCAHERVLAQSTYQAQALSNWVGYGQGLTPYNSMLAWDDGYPCGMGYNPAWLDGLTAQVLQTEVSGRNCFGVVLGMTPNTGSNPLRSADWVTQRLDTITFYGIAATDPNTNSPWVIVKDMSQVTWSSSNVADYTLLGSGRAVYGGAPNRWNDAVANYTASLGGITVDRPKKVAVMICGLRAVLHSSDTALNGIRTTSTQGTQNVVYNTGRGFRFELSRLCNIGSTSAFNTAANFQSFCNKNLPGQISQESLLYDWDTVTRKWIRNARTCSVQVGTGWVSPLAPACSRPSRLFCGNAARVMSGSWPDPLDVCGCWIVDEQRSGCSASVTLVDNSYLFRTIRLLSSFAAEEAVAATTRPRFTDDEPAPVYDEFSLDIEYSLDSLVATALDTDARISQAITTEGPLNLMQAVNEDGTPVPPRSTERESPSEPTQAEVAPPTATHPEIIWGSDGQPSKLRLALLLDGPEGQAVQPGNSDFAQVNSATTGQSCFADPANPDETLCAPQRAVDVTVDVQTVFEAQITRLRGGIRRTFGSYANITRGIYRWLWEGKGPLLPSGDSKSGRGASAPEIQRSMGRLTSTTINLRASGQTAALLKLHELYLGSTYFGMWKVKSITINGETFNAPVARSSTTEATGFSAGEMAGTAIGAFAGALVLVALVAAVVLAVRTLRARKVKELEGLQNASAEEGLELSSLKSLEEKSKMAVSNSLFVDQM